MGVTLRRQRGTDVYEVTAPWCVEPQVGVRSSGVVSSVRRGKAWGRKPGQRGHLWDEEKTKDLVQNQRHQNSCLGKASF